MLVNNSYKSAIHINQRLKKLEIKIIKNNKSIIFFWRDLNHDLNQTTLGTKSCHSGLEFGELDGKASWP